MRSLLRAPFLGLIVSSTPRGSLDRWSCSLANSKLFNQPELTIHLAAARIPLTVVSIVWKSLVPASDRFRRSESCSSGPPPSLHPVIAFEVTFALGSDYSSRPGLHVVGGQGQLSPESTAVYSLSIPPTRLGVRHRFGLLSAPPQALIAR